MQVINSANEKSCSGESGMGLIAVVILIAIATIVGFVTSQQFKNEFRAQETLDVRVAELAIFDYVKRIMDCDKTKSYYTSCPASGYLRIDSKALGIPVAIKDFSIVGLSGATVIGSYYVRARCSNPKKATDKSIFLEASPIKLKKPVWSNVNPNVALGCALL
jgi:hypothetical protein